MTIWVPIRDTQLPALAEVLKRAETSALLITNHHGERGVIVAVPPSTTDTRRWDIDRAGTITPLDRETGVPREERA